MSYGSCKWYNKRSDDVMARARTAIGRWSMEHSSAVAAGGQKLMAHDL
jgi:hypothetical protein